MGKLLTTAEVAERLGITTRRVVGLIADGILPAQQYSGVHLIHEKDLPKAVKRQKPGRPKKK